MYFSYIFNLTLPQFKDDFSPSESFYFFDLLKENNLYFKYFVVLFDLNRGAT